MGRGAAAITGAAACGGLTLGAAAGRGAVEAGEVVLAGALAELSTALTVDGAPRRSAVFSDGPLAVEGACATAAGFS